MAGGRRRTASFQRLPFGLLARTEAAPPSRPGATFSLDSHHACRVGLVKMHELSSNKTKQLDKLIPLGRLHDVSFGFQDCTAASMSRAVVCLLCRSLHWLYLQLEHGGARIVSLFEQMQKRRALGWQFTFLAFIRLTTSCGVPYLRAHSLLKLFSFHYTAVTERSKSNQSRTSQASQQSVGV